MTASRSPVTHQHTDEQTFQDDQAHRVVPAHQRGDLEGDDRVQPEPGGERERQVAAHAHDDRHHRGHQSRRGGQLHRIQRVSELVLRAAEDDGIQDKDVGHREERGEAAAYLTGEGGSPLGDPEVPVDGHGRCSLVPE
ncbi:UNVERIFIED_CONTAM: hypothetical protein RKD50_002457 [Streptomyces canus]